MASLRRKNKKRQKELEDMRRKLKKFPLFTYKKISLPPPFVLTKDDNRNFPATRPPLKAVFKKLDALPAPQPKEDATSEIKVLEKLLETLIPKIFREMRYITKIRSPLQGQKVTPLLPLKKGKKKKKVFLYHQLRQSPSQNDQEVQPAKELKHNRHLPGLT
jgi:hypothetical protein